MGNTGPQMNPKARSLCSQKVLATYLAKHSNMLPDLARVSDGHAVGVPCGCRAGARVLFAMERKHFGVPATQTRPGPLG